MDSYANADANQYIYKYTSASYIDPKQFVADCRCRNSTGPARE